MPEMQELLLNFQQEAQETNFYCRKNLKRKKIQDMEELLANIDKSENNIFINESLTNIDQK